MATQSATRPWILRRPSGDTGISGWLTTVDHKKIGILYLVTSFSFFILGGLEAFLIRLQLAEPESSVISPELYSQLFGMHALTMVFLAVMPLSAAFFNLIIPLQIGARDMATGLLNMIAYWLFFISRKD